MSKASKAIDAITGHEPCREDELPEHYEVGVAIAYHRKDFREVSAILYREHDYGDHGIGWFDVYVEGELKLSMSAKAVATVEYRKEAE